MKFWYPIIFLFCFIPVDAQEDSTSVDSVRQITGPHLEVNSVKVDFGIKNQFAPVQFDFRLKNIGDTPVKITGLTYSCKCVLSNTPNEIEPGQTASIAVTYDSKRIGPFNETITLNTNAINNKKLALKLRGEVRQKPAPSW